MAHMWLNIMASDLPGTLEEFHMAAKAQLALLQAKMIPAQIAEAQKLARECVAKKYRGAEHTCLTSACGRAKRQLRGGVKYLSWALSRLSL